MAVRNIVSRQFGNVLGRYFNSGKRQVSWTIAIALTLILSGCGGMLTADPVPDLRVPGAERITALDNVLSQNAVSPISDLAAYAGPEPGHPLHLLVLVDRSLYDVDVDGRRARLVVDESPCAQQIAVSQDSAWAACQAVDGIRMFPLPPVSTANGSLDDRLVLASEADDHEFYSPTWGLDGRSLAVLRRRSGKSAAIMVYTVPDAHDTVRAMAEIDLAYIQEPAAISWSPDGAWLHLLDSIGYLLPAHPLLTSTGTRTINPPQVEGVIAGVTGLPVMWRPNDGALTLVQDANIVTREPKDGRETTLLTIPGGTVYGLAWSPDGLRLLIGLCRHVPFDIIPPPCKLYAYTPPKS